METSITTPLSYYRIEGRGKFLDSLLVFVKDACCTSVVGYLSWHNGAFKYPHNKPRI